MSLLIKNIKQLLLIDETYRLKVSGKDMDILNSITDAYLISKNGIIADYGQMDKMPVDEFENQENIIIDAKGKMVLPAFCDSHTHLVYPQSRESEFVDRIKGLSYEEIAKRGGGILNSASKMEQVSEDELYNSALIRLNEIMSFGTACVEIKSGYGLSTGEELKMLRVIKKLKESVPVRIKATFLGAHAIPLIYRNRPDDYVDLIINEMIPQVAAEQLADFIDVFCEKGFFNVLQTERILKAGAIHGLRPKIHANELYFSGGIQTGVKFKAVSVDHLECTGEDEIKALLASDTMPTVLPGASFFLGLPYAPARKIIDAGLPLAMASDYNPGSSPSGNMQLILSMGCIKYKLSPAETLHASTINGAAAMLLSDITGSITKGKKADLIITKEIPSYAFIPYSYGSNKVDTLIIDGEIVYNISCN